MEKNTNFPNVRNLFLTNCDVDFQKFWISPKYFPELKYVYCQSGTFSNQCNDQIDYYFIDDSVHTIPDTFCDKILQVDKGYIQKRLEMFEWDSGITLIN